MQNGEKTMDTHSLLRQKQCICTGKLNSFFSIFYLEFEFDSHIRGDGFHPFKCEVPNNSNMGCTSLKWRSTRWSIRNNFQLILWNTLK